MVRADPVLPQVATEVGEELRAGGVELPGGGESVGGVQRGTPEDGAVGGGDARGQTAGHGDVNGGRRGGQRGVDDAGAFQDGVDAFTRGGDGRNDVLSGVLLCHGLILAQGRAQNGSS
ncbi:MAG: hypothetical protein ACTH1D_07390 [Mycobacteriaceae bacterium]